MRRSDDVARLLDAAACKTGAPRLEMRLDYGGKPLQAGETLGRHQIGAGATVQLSFRGRGGGCGASKATVQPSAALAPGLPPTPVKQELPHHEETSAGRSEADQLAAASLETALVLNKDSASPYEGEGRQPASPSKIHGSDEILHALSKLDGFLMDALRDGHIRLLRATWLLQQPPSYRMERRQELESYDQPPSPLLSPDEAVALLRAGNRGIGSLSYGWLMSRAVG